jgi:hypothetical protein
MDLDGLYRRLEYEQGAEKDDKPVKLMDSDGNRFEILSVNWDDGQQEWVIVGDYFG